MQQLRTHLAELAIAIAVAVVSGPTLAATGVFGGAEKALVVAPGDQADPAISGQIVAYTDGASGDADVYYYDDATGTIHAVAVGPGNQEFSDVSGGLIAYTDYTGLAPAEVYTYDIATGVATNISNRPDSDQLNPAVSAQLVAWEDKRFGLQHIFVRVLATGVTQQISMGPPQSAPTASGGRVAYVDSSIGSQVKVWDLATGTTTTLTAASASQPDLDGDNLAYVDMSGADWEVVVHNVVSGTDTTLTLAGNQANPKISGDFVAFEDQSSGTSHIALWHWTGGELFYFSPPTSQQTLHDISGQRIVYTDNRKGNGDLDIFAYDFTFTIPPSPTRPTGVPTDKPASTPTSTRTAEAPMDTATPTSTSTATPSNTSTATATNTATVAATPTRTPTSTATVTSTTTHTPTPTVTPPPPASCSDTSITPFADYTVRRVRGVPGVGSAYFPSPLAQPVKVCIDAVNVAAGYVLVDLNVVATPPDFGPGTIHLERPSTVNKGFNASAILMNGPVGASVHVRIVPGP